MIKSLIEVKTITEVIIPQEIMFQVMASYINKQYGLTALPENIKVQYGNGDSFPKTIQLFYKQENEKK